MSSYSNEEWRFPLDLAGFEVDCETRKTWAGPIRSEMYGKGLKELCNKTKESLSRLSVEMRQQDPCFEYGMEHWHPTKRPVSGVRHIERLKSKGNWENVDVMFDDNKTIEELTKTKNDDSDSSNSTPGPVNKFCYLCSTMEEHKRHLHLHKPRRRVKSAKARVMYLAPKPKQKPTVEEEEVLVKERLYKLEVFTSDHFSAGTDANVFVTIKGSLGFLPKQKLVKKRGCSKLCFMRASKEVFHIQGPFLGNLEILTIEHDGKKRTQGWHLDRIEVTDVKALKTWVFWCDDWLSIYEKPFYSNKRDLVAEDKKTPLTEFNIEVHTGKQKMAGTDANVFITMFGEHGASKKIHLVDPSSNKKCFEKNSIDKFQVQMDSIGELRRIRIEHDGKGFAAGWHLNKVVIVDSRKPKQKYYFLYNGWIAKDEGEGKLWREITAKKTLPKELREGTTTNYHIKVKTGDIRFAGTDANVFIQMSGPNGITPKLKLDDAKNNFERNMVDTFDVEAVNVGPLESIIIGHDNSGPGAGWFLDHVEVRRFLPREEVLERLKRMKKKLKEEQRKKKKDPDMLDESSSEDEDGDLQRRMNRIERKKDKKKHKHGDSSSKSGGNFFTVSSESSSSSSGDSSSDEDHKHLKGKQALKDSKSHRPGSAVPRHRRAGSADDRPGSGLSQRRISTSASGLLGKGAYRDEEGVKDLKVPLYEEYVFVCEKWLAADMDDGLCVRELKVTKKTVFFKE